MYRTSRLDIVVVEVKIGVPVVHELMYTLSEDTPWLAVELVFKWQHGPHYRLLIAAPQTLSRDCPHLQLLTGL